MQKAFLITASLAGCIAVIFGAFGAHSLKAVLEPYQIAIWEKGVQYQFYHTMALFICYFYLRKEQADMVRNAAICFILGILCFSGSLYLLATAGLTHLPTSVLGPITPIGGFFFIAGWGFILVHAIRKD